MNELSTLGEVVKDFSGYSTTFVLIVGGLLTWWKVLPSLIDAISNRQSNIEKRMGELLDGATERFEREIAASDARHAECMEGQRLQREQIAKLESRVDEQTKTIIEQREKIDGLKRQFMAMQQGVVRLGATPPSPEIDSMLEQLDQIPRKGK